MNPEPLLPGQKETNPDQNQSISQPRDDPIDDPSGTIKIKTKADPNQETTSLTIPQTPAIPKKLSRSRKRDQSRTRPETKPDPKHDNRKTPKGPQQYTLVSIKYSTFPGRPRTRTKNANKTKICSPKTRNARDSSKSLNLSSRGSPSFHPVSYLMTAIILQKYSSPS